MVLGANKNITFSEVVEILKNEEIEYEFDKNNHEGALEYIRLVNGITIDFDNELSACIYDDSKGDWDVKSELILNQKDFILNGIRLFKY